MAFFRSIFGWLKCAQPKDAPLWPWRQDPATAYVCFVWEAARIDAENNKLKAGDVSYIINQFSLGVAPNTEIATKTEETWMRSKERLKGEPIDWSKTIDRSYFDRAIAMR